MDITEVTEDINPQGGMKDLMDRCKAQDYPRNWGVQEEEKPGEDGRDRKQTKGYCVPYITEEVYKNLEYLAHIELEARSRITALQQLPIPEKERQAKVNSCKERYLGLIHAAMTDVATRYSPDRPEQWLAEHRRFVRDIKDALRAKDPREYLSPKNKKMMEDTDYEIATTEQIARMLFSTSQRTLKS